MTICAVAGPAWTSEYRCLDPKAEQIRQALDIHYDLAEKRRTLECCIAHEWTEQASGAKGLWIFGIVERVYPSLGGEYVFRLYVVRQEEGRFIFVRRARAFRVLWPEAPHWQQTIVGFEAGDLASPLGFPAFGVRLRADYTFKMEARWEERLVLFAMEDLLEPFFSTSIRTCNCDAQGEEAYPTSCFEKPACAGAEVSATLVLKRGDKQQPYTLTKLVPAKKVSLDYTWNSEGSERLYLDPLEEPIGTGVESCDTDGKYN
jgi:hypothetical protein